MRLGLLAAGSRRQEPTPDKVVAVDVAEQWRVHVNRSRRQHVRIAAATPAPAAADVPPPP